MGRLFRVSSSVLEEDDAIAAGHRRRRFRIEPNIRLGEIIVVTTLILGGMGAWYGLKGQTEQNARDIQTLATTQRDRDASQDAVVSRIEVNLKDGIQQIRSEQVELRREVGEIGRYVRSKGP